MSDKEKQADTPMDILIYIAVSISVRICCAGRFLVRARPCTIGRVQAITVGDIFFVVLRREESLGLASLAVQAKLMTEATRRIGWARRTGAR